MESIAKTMDASLYMDSDQKMEIQPKIGTLQRDLVVECLKKSFANAEAIANCIQADMHKEIAHYIRALDGQAETVEHAKNV